MLFVAGRHVVGDEGNVDIGLSDEKSLHSFSVGWWMVLVPPHFHLKTETSRVRIFSAITGDKRC